MNAAMSSLNGRLMAILLAAVSRVWCGSADKIAPVSRRGIGPASKDAAAAKAFIQYVTGPVGAGALRSKGMDPS